MGDRGRDLARRHGGVGGGVGDGAGEDCDEGLDGADLECGGEEGLAANAHVRPIAGEDDGELGVEEEAEGEAGCADDVVLVWACVGGAERAEEADEQGESAGLLHGDVRVDGPARLA